VLINCFDDLNSQVRGNAAIALGDYGTDAKSAIPQLVGLLNDKGKGVRNSSALAIKMIDPEAAVKAGLR
jgi:HEAT repeat protein